LGGCPEEVIEENLSAHSPPAGINSLMDQTKTVEVADGCQEVRTAWVPVPAQMYLGGREEPVAAVVVEVSKSRVQLLADEPAPVGTSVRIDMGDLVVQGDIRHCQPRLDKRSYTVGVLRRDITESDHGDRGRPGTAGYSRRNGS